MLLSIVLTISVALAGACIFSSVPRKLILGWLGVGISQSLFLLIVGFELLALINLLFVLASGTVLQIYSALFGTAAIGEVEREILRRDWIVGIGAGLTLSGVLGFAAVGIDAEGIKFQELGATEFVKEILSRFPELPLIMVVALFFAMILWASIGRPGWKNPREENLKP